MHVYFHPQIIAYDGSQLSSLWAYRTFGLLGESIVSFRGPCRVDFAHMVDVEDLKNRSPIYGSDMLHFVVEHFDHDLEKAVLRQRLLVAVARDILEEKAGVKLLRRGDDLFFQERKLSISIATASPVSTMMHFALNISPEGTPVPAAGLIEMGFSPQDIPGLAEGIGQAYALEIQGVLMARCKVRGVT
ncbi:DUF366 family protein [Desulfovirgula thermocuniculi]|uniref:DUF366 family protein n=1 Tax=Desulfovirgula thermocuniculi TaxID=348842 RepID=UPI000418C1DF|nr:DUF366 family protein [Desulfovirgula thermocuniculi]